MPAWAITAKQTAVQKQKQIDESLISRIAGGDRQAFLKLYEQCSSSVYAYALSMLRNVSDAEDVMQDTFLKIHGAAHLYKAKGKPMAWILTITRNLCLMKLRKTSDLMAVSFEEAVAAPLRETVHQSEDRIVLTAALSMLSPEESQIILLHAVSGLKHREIAELMQLPLSTVLSKYNRGTKKLRKELEGKL
ncbi:MAG: RNA polymerase sigma factor [Lachnospiraceae bacterium]|nr:RNA polymerase sigma factor [Lachnospiraceae bacterium]